MFLGRHIEMFGKREDWIGRGGGSRMGDKEAEALFFFSWPPRRCFAGCGILSLQLLSSRAPSPFLLYDDESKRA